MSVVETPPKPRTSSRRCDESKLQVECFKYMWNTHPETRLLYFAVLNENTQSKYESKKQQLISGAERKARGVISGVSDNILFMPKGKYHGCCAEAKTEIGRQSEAQVIWQEKVEEQGYYYFVYHNFEEFKTNIEYYLSLQ
jgi:hypothetical protein